MEGSRQEGLGGPRWAWIQNSITKAGHSPTHSSVVSWLPQTRHQLFWVKALLELSVDTHRMLRKLAVGIIEMKKVGHNQSNKKERKYNAMRVGFGIQQIWVQVPVLPSAYLDDLGWITSLVLPKYSLPRTGIERQLQEPLCSCYWNWEGVIVMY